MLFGETVAVYCETHTEHTHTVRTSHETHYVSATETNRLMLFQSQSHFTTDGQSVSMSWCRAQIGTFDQRYYFFLFVEAVAVYCENHTEHTDTVRTSQETHYVSLQIPAGYYCLGKQSLFIVGTIRNTQIRLVGRVQSLNMLTGAVHIVTTRL
jgi:hypothetical protein